MPTPLLQEPPLNAHLQKVRGSYLPADTPLPEALFLERFGESEGVLSALSLLHKGQRPLVWVTQNSEEQSLRMAQLQGLGQHATGYAIHYLPSSALSRSEGPRAESSTKDRSLQAYASRELHQIAGTLQDKKPAIILAEAEALCSPLPSFEQLRGGTLTLHEELEIDPKEVAQLLEAMGYKEVPLVERQGEFCLKRDLLDLFDAGAMEPVRISFWGEQIEQIHTFHPQSQRTLASLKEVTLHQADAQKLRRGEKNLLEQLPKEWTILIDQPDLVEQQCIDLLEADDYKKLTQSLSKRKLLFLSKHGLHALQSQEPPSGSPSFSWLDHQFPIATINSKAVAATIAFPVLQESDGTSGKSHLLLETALEQDYSLALFYQTPAEKKRILRWLQDRCCTSCDEKAIEKLLEEKKISLFGSDLPDPICYLEQKILFSRFDQLQQEQRALWRPTLRKEHSLSTNKSSHFQPGDYIVHLKHGIGVFKGIEPRKTPGSAKQEEYIRLEYEDRAQLWVPLSQAHLLHPYESFDASAPKVHKIGSTNWAKQLKQAKNSVEGYAKDLLELYAKRSMKEGFICSGDSPLYQEFEEDFPYTLSEDQARAIEEVKKDLVQSKPMDRLLCGDVGFGKTEVAMRAACKTAIDGGHQVAVLAPTTVLALQHYETFSARMRQTPLRIEMLTRMQKTKEKKRILEALANGQVDILIGTHRLLSEDVKFLRLGLVVVDEEHRFGVRAKEKLKKMKESVNYLCLSATPIPRTLHLSMMGAKEFSHINTAPDDRLPVATIVTPYSDLVIEKALKLEIARGGQAFFVHNHIDELYTFSSHFKKRMPSLRVAIVHGQMEPTAIEEIFHSFQRREIDLLMATTIIETGIDIANANTLFVYRAHHYGLSDLHQLRGRVGRWNRQAYAYFLTPAQSELSEQAHERLNALSEHSYLGGGMQLALRDLQIRGCGNILGQEQSGHVCNVGFAYYCQLLKETIAKLEKRKTALSKSASQVFPVSLSWPLETGSDDSFIADSTLRLDFHRRLGQAETLEEIEEIFDELIDRFGELTEIEKSLQKSFELPYHLAQVFQRSPIPSKAVQSIEIRQKAPLQFSIEIAWNISQKPPLCLHIEEKQIQSALNRKGSLSIALAESVCERIQNVIGTIATQEEKGCKNAAKHNQAKKSCDQVKMKLKASLKRALRSYQQKL